jgi:hypothetical protein
LRLVPRNLRRKPTIIALFANIKKNIFATDEKINEAPAKHTDSHMTSKHEHDTINDDEDFSYSGTGATKNRLMKVNSLIATPIGS